MPWLHHNQRSNLGGTFGQYGYDLLDYEFHLLVEGKLSGVFERLTGGEIEVATVKHDVTFESGSSTTLFIPGTTTFNPFTLERGFALYYELYYWLMQASNGDIIQARRDGSVEMRKQGEALLRWNFYRAWPTKLSGFNYNQYTDAQKARVSITIQPESIEFDDDVNPSPNVLRRLYGS
jgi:phage tail-like protein